MKRFWLDHPDFAAKQCAALIEGNKRRWADPEFRAKRLNELAYQRCSPACVNWPRLRLKDPARAKFHSNLLLRMNTDPEIIARRKKALKDKWADPQFKARMTEARRRNGDKRRGFKVPRSMWAEYQRLRRRKSMPAIEAGRILGLVK